MVKIIRSCALFVALLVAGVTVFAGESRTNWHGVYEYSDDVGVGQPFEMKLTVGEDSCDLTWTGFQINLDIECRADATEKLLSVVFIKYKPVEFMTGPASLVVGSVLFSLNGSGKKLTTTWVKLKPMA